MSSAQWRLFRLDVLIAVISRSLFWRCYVGMSAGMNESLGNRLVSGR